MPYSSIKDIIEKEYPRNTQLRAIETYPLSFLIYAAMINCNCSSYLELGSGYGGVMLIAGTALADARKIYRRKTDIYELVGIEAKKHRIEEAEKILGHRRFRYKFIHANVLDMEWTRDMDAIFIDCGEEHSQVLINRFAPYAKKLIFVHDVVTSQNLKFPNNWTIMKFPEQRALMAINKDYENYYYKKIPSRK